MKLIRLGNGQFNLTDVLDALPKQLSTQQFVTAIQDLIVRGFGDRCRDAIDFVEIMANQTAFRADNAEQIGVLEDTSRTWGFSRWLQQQGKDPTTANRDDITTWWDFYMTMASENGFIPAGTINTKTQKSNLWKATGPLATKMMNDPAQYMYLPALLINNAELVAKALREIKNPRAFVEILTGEAWEDMSTCEEFMNGFATTEEKGTKGAIATVMLALQRSGK